MNEKTFSDPPASGPARAPSENDALVHASGIQLGTRGHAEPARASWPGGWQLSATFSWLLVLSVLGVLVARFAMWLSVATCVVQAALVAFVFMRVLWDRRANYVFGLVALAFIGLRAAAVLLDRAEYQPELDRFEATPLDPGHLAPRASD